MRNYILFFSFIVLSFSAFSQKDSIAIKNIKIKKIVQLNSNDYNPLSPSKAAFYSAIFPGMGQIYNKKYWKVPIVWGAIGTSIYYYIKSSNDYNRYRTAFKLRERGLKDEFKREDGTFSISRSGLINAQKKLNKNKDLSLLTAILFYVLQIVEASVNAHLLQFNTNDNLSIKPIVVPDFKIVEAPKLGIQLSYSF